LILSEWGWRNHPTANFYLAPTRAWELLAGSISAFILQKEGLKSNNYLSFLGLGAIIFAVFFYDENTPFPSVYALVPVIGTVMLVLYAHGDTLAGKFLSIKVLVGIGLISYSAYLWHQPLFAFAKVRSIDKPSDYLLILLSISSIMLALISWRFVEQPFRSKNNISRNGVFIVSIVFGAVFLSIGLAGTLVDHSLQHQRYYDFSQLDYNRHWEGWSNCQYVSVTSKKYGGCKILHPKKPVDVVVIGDSHAGHLASGIRHIFGKSDLNFAVLLHAGWFPGIYVGDSGRFQCSGDLIREAIEFSIKESSVEAVMLSGYGIVKLTGGRFADGKSGRVDVDRTNEFRQGLHSAVQILESHNKQVVLIGDTPELKTKSPGRCLLWNNCERLKVPRLEFEKRMRPYLEILETVNKRYPNVKVILPHEYFCDKDYCYGYMNGELLYQSDDHLTPNGSMFLIKKIRHLFNWLGLADVE